MRGAAGVERRLMIIWDDEAEGQHRTGDEEVEAALTVV